MTKPKLLPCPWCKAPYRPEVNFRETDLEVRIRSHVESKHSRPLYDETEQVLLTGKEMARINRFIDELTADRAALKAENERLKAIEDRAWLNLRIMNSSGHASCGASAAIVEDILGIPTPALNQKGGE